MMFSQKLLIGIVLISIISVTGFIGWNYLLKSKTSESSGQYPPSEPQPSPSLNVYVYEEEFHWNRDSKTDLPLYKSTIAYNVKNEGEAVAQNVKITVYVNDEIYTQRSLDTLNVYESFSNDFSISINYDRFLKVKVKASCTDSSDTAILTVKSELPRTEQKMDTNLMKLYITPEDGAVKSLAENVATNPLIPNWMEIRD